MNFLRLISKGIGAYNIMLGKGKSSFSQIGEDRILTYLFYNLGLSKISYLDIGANEPVAGSNTYLFYLFGSKGVCVEPNPALFKKIQKIRPKDTCLNVGIGLHNTASADFYVFPESGWSTFSKEEAEYRKSNGQPYTEVIQMPLKNVNEIIQENFTTAPDLISIDVEGLDFEILQSLDFDKYAPKALVVETIRFGDSAKAEKQQNIIDFVCSKGYFVYADTHVNTIFCQSNISQ
jgi:FkbM family methyltransferase